MNVIDNLSKNTLFKGLDLKEIEKIYSDLRYKRVIYEKDQIIAVEDDKCTSIGLVLSGEINIKNVLTAHQYCDTMKAVKRGTQTAESQKRRTK